jgi:hypothetical protein
LCAIAFVRVTSRELSKVFAGWPLRSSRPSPFQRLVALPALCFSPLLRGVLHPNYSFKRTADRMSR